MGNSWTSATKEDVMLGNIIVYPNPVSEKINIESEYKITTPMFINLSNLLGKVILSREVDWVQNQRTTIDVSNFAKGIYMLEIEINDQIHIQRIVVE